MTECSRRRFLELAGATGGALVFGDLLSQVLGVTSGSGFAAGCRTHQDRHSGSSFNFLQDLVDS